MIEIRTFRNYDPPAIRELWNRNAQNRGFGKIARQDILENCVFSKLFFDPKGFFLAFDSDKLVGVSHAGFGCLPPDESRTHSKFGVVAMVLVDPSRQREGIGKQLLDAANQYLTSNGAEQLYLGSIFPLDPFYTGLYGGSELPGILKSSSGGIEFANKYGYEKVDETIIYELNLGKLAPLKDKRVSEIRDQIEINVEAAPLHTTWWKAATRGHVFDLCFSMNIKNGEPTNPNQPLLKQNKNIIGKATAWDMESFSLRADRAVVGITDVLIDQEYRGKGYGRLLLHSILRYLREQSIDLIEMQTMVENVAAQKMYESIGFVEVDRGSVFCKNSW